MGAAACLGGLCLRREARETGTQLGGRSGSSSGRSGAARPGADDEPVQRLRTMRVHRATQGRRWHSAGRRRLRGCPATRQ